MNKHSFAEINSAYRYDSESGILYRRDPRYIKMYGPVAHVVKGDGYGRVTHRGRGYPTHWVCWLLHYGEWPTQQVDHINRVRNDNRIANLRLATPAQNGWNRAGAGRNAKGVTFHKGVGRFQAQIKANGKSRYLGLFDTEAEAHAAYCTAANALHGDFRRFSA